MGREPTLKRWEDISERERQRLWKLEGEPITDVIAEMVSEFASRAGISLEEAWSMIRLATETKTLRNANLRS